NTVERTYQIHGNINFMRCSKECTASIYPTPSENPPKAKDERLREEDRMLLVCPRCGSLTRPHVLWFDECYDEKFFRFESSLQRAVATHLLLVVGTSGATNLPMQIGTVVARNGAAIIDINPTPNPFSRMAESTSNGHSYPGKSGEILPEIVDFLRP
ncbi:MAG: Sir2 family NAD-dependent protein deacetylase, partial [Pseudomonadota bacterium]